MSSAPAVCFTPGCPELAPCPTHRPHHANGTERRRRRGVTNSGWEEQDRNRRTIRRHQGVCHWCGQSGATEVDHVIPRQQGGSDGEDNRRPIHHACHVEKNRVDAARGQAG